MSIRIYNFNDRDGEEKADVFGVHNCIFEEEVNEWDNSGQEPEGVRLTKNAKLLYIYLCSMEKFNLIETTKRKLMKEMKMSSDGVLGALNQLEKNKFITRDSKTSSIMLNRDLDYTNKGHYFLIHFSVVQDLEIMKNKETKLVYAYLCRRVVNKAGHKDNQKGNPSIEEITTACRIGEPALDKALSELEELELVSITKGTRKTEDGKVWKTRHVYTLLEIPEAFTGEEVEEEEENKFVKSDMPNQKEKVVATNNDQEENTYLISDSSEIINQNDEMSNYFSENKGEDIDTFLASIGK
ncbi:hypothetical protein FZC84_21135 [Rossellomorea vietnamensis]|uniref:Uncharacterized protein n=1 Tax=Rossellomorea vietnamensis TaxID=218284 RepID=A0A5D4M1K9_9BACI|nr:hypothetical protein [Rossellomorea vietnamensis]TYR95699.1 hypothetical protein FZC84_21135 [Rossellomorea vietnamensis]